MGYRLAGEVLEHCPDLPYRQFRVLMVLALDATDSTRRAMPGLDAITLRANSGRRTAQRAVDALRASGLIKTVRYAAPGVRAIYEIAPMPGTHDTELSSDTHDTELSSDAARTHDNEVAPERTSVSEQRTSKSGRTHDNEVAHTESTTESSASLSRAERGVRVLLADLGATEREIISIISTAGEDPKIDHPLAYLRKTLVNGDGHDLLAATREQHARQDRFRVKRGLPPLGPDGRPLPEPEPAPVVALVPEPEPLPAEPDDGDDGEPEPESLSWWPGDELTDVVDAEEWAPF